MRPAHLLALAVAFAATPAAAQPPTKSSPPRTPAAEPAKPTRFLYLVRYGTAKDLAAALSQHFKDEPGFEVVPEATANALLVTASPGVGKEMVQLLDQLDRRPRQVVLEVLAAELPLDEADGGLDPAALGGQADAVFQKVEALARKSGPGQYRRFRLAALENQRSLVQVGGSKPQVTGVNMAPGGLRGAAGGGAPVNQISYRNVGTMLSATPRVGAGGTVTVELSFEDSRMHTPDDGVALAPGAVAAEVIQTMFRGTLSVAPGKAVVAEGVKTVAKARKSQTVLLVTASVSE